MAHANKYPEKEKFSILLDIRKLFKTLYLQATGSKQCTAHENATGI